MMYNIDGDLSNSWGWDDPSIYNGGRFFGCFIGDDSDNEDGGEERHDLCMMTDVPESAGSSTSTEGEPGEDSPSPPRATPATFAELLEQYKSLTSNQDGQQKKKGRRDRMLRRSR